VNIAPILKSISLFTLKASTSRKFGFYRLFTANSISLCVSDEKWALKNSMFGFTLFTRSIISNPIVSPSRSQSVQITSQSMSRLYSFMFYMTWLDDSIAFFTSGNLNKLSIFVDVQFFVLSGKSTSVRFPRTEVTLT